ncbi:MAG: hypothetical protein ACRCXT_07420 [Paraclostridium sp.]
MDVLENKIGAVGVISSDIVQRVLSSNEMSEKIFNLLEKSFGLNLRIIRSYLGDEQTVEFLDVMSGAKIVFPDYRKLSDIFLSVVISEYHTSMGSDEHNLKFIAKKFGINVPYARKLIMMCDENYNPNNEITEGMKKELSEFDSEDSSDFIYDDSDYDYED